MSDKVLGWLIPAITAILILALLFAVMAWQDDRCQAKGGHLIRVDRSSICVSPDGRVIE